jgi:hypothetical protein
MPFCDPFKQNLKRHISLDLIGDYKPSSEENWFFAIGRVSSWGSTGPINDTYPPFGTDSDSSETEFWRNLIAAKRIGDSDISLVVPRYDWSSGQIYIPYRDDVDLFDDVNPAKFYVLVDEERVYKCIDNAYGSPSTVPPTHTDTQIRKLSDGYRWKFLYQIPESKRKFLTRTFVAEGTALETIARQGYMPVEFVDFLRLNDDRTLQYSVQQSAVDGEIAFTEFKEEYFGFVSSDNTCLLPSTNHVGVSITGSGGVTGKVFTGYSPNLIGISGNYVGRVLSIDTGNLIGSRRLITDYQFDQSNSQGTFTVSPSFAQNQVLSNTNFSILPSLVIDGDGVAGDNPPNPGLGYADITVKFGNSLTGITGCDVFAGERKFVTGFEMVDTGKRYTFATIDSIAGLTFVGITANINDIADIIISPPGGHGSDPVRELGAASLMIVKEFNSDENGTVSIANEFRQFGIVKNPDLYTPVVQMYLERGGATGSFSVGGTATQGFTGFDGSTGFSLAQGRITSWLPGWQITGPTAYGSSELRVTGLTGTFKYGGIVNSGVGVTFGVVGLETITKAGKEARFLTQLEVVSEDPLAVSSTSFRRGQYVQGIGNLSNGISPSHATGRVYSFSALAGSTTRAILLLEDANGTFNEAEKVIACDYYLRPIHSLTSSDALRISAISETTTGVPSIYKTTSKIILNSGASGGLFTSSTFSEDDLVTFASGSNVAYGTVVEYAISSTSATGTAEMLLSGVNGTFAVGMTATYTYGTSQYVASITGVEHTPDLKYRSGEVSYIQNIRPVQRSDEQKEEFKIVINF